MTTSADSRPGTLDDPPQEIASLAGRESSSWTTTSKIASGDTDVDRPKRGRVASVGPLEDASDQGIINRIAAKQEKG
jgi:hypothetical protein